MIGIDEASYEVRRLKEIDEKDFPSAESAFNDCWRRLREWTQQNPSEVCPPGFNRIGPAPHDFVQAQNELGKAMQRRNALLAERGGLRRALGIDR